MPPKKAAPAKKAASTASHPPYLDMIKEAVVALKEKGGSSRQALKKYVQANNDLKGVTDAAFTTQFNKALLKGSESGTFTRPKGSSGPVKLAAPSAAAKPAAKKTATAAKPATAAKSATAAKPKTAKATTAKKPAAKKATTTKSATAKKPAAKKATATKTKSKANTTKVRKTPAAAPAVVEEKPVVLGKTKSGRVTKSKAPAEARKAIAPKNSRKAPAKKATAKKA